MVYWSLMHFNGFVVGNFPYFLFATGIHQPCGHSNIYTEAL